MNIPIALMALAWGLIETAYFGWNWTPKSDAELFCDGLSLFFFALAIAVGRKP